MWIIKIKERATYKARFPYFRCFSLRYHNVPWNWRALRLFPFFRYKGTLTTSTPNLLSLGINVLLLGNISTEICGLISPLTDEEDFLAKLLMCVIARFATTYSYCCTVYSWFLSFSAKARLKDSLPTEFNRHPGTRKYLKTGTNHKAAQ